jgi:hypothetical protein
LTILHSSAGRLFRKTGASMKIPSSFAAESSQKDMADLYSCRLIRLLVQPYSCIRLQPYCISTCSLSCQSLQVPRASRATPINGFRLRHWRCGRVCAQHMGLRSRVTCKIRPRAWAARRGGRAILSPSKRRAAHAAMALLSMLASDHASLGVCSCLVCQRMGVKPC